MFQSHFLNCFGFVFSGLFLLLCFPPREVPLAFVIKLVWWCWILLTLFAQLLGFSFGFGLPLHVGHPQAPVPLPDRRGLKQQLIRALLLTQAGKREGYGSHNLNAGHACVGRGRYDVAAGWGTACVLPGMLSLDHGTPAVVGCTGSRGHVGSDLCLHTGFLLAVAAAIAVHTCLRGPSW